MTLYGLDADPLRDRTNFNRYQTVCQIIMRNHEPESFHELRALNTESQTLINNHAINH